MNYKIEIAETTRSVRHVTLHAESLEEAEKIAAERFAGRRDDGFGNRFDGEVLSVEPEDGEPEVF